MYGVCPGVHVYGPEHAHSAPSCDQDLTSAVAEMFSADILASIRLFSSHTFGSQAQHERVCYFVPVYDFTPEHMGDYNGQ